MSEVVNVNFKIDSDTKKAMESVCADIGITMSAAFTIFAKKVGRERRIPFELSADPFYSDANMRYLKKKKEEYQNGTMMLSEHELLED